MKSICFVLLLFSLSTTTPSTAQTSPNSPANSRALRCIFTSTHQYGHLRQLYSCDISTRVYITHRDTSISSISGNHTTDRQNSGVVALKSDASVIHYFPKNLEKFFPNLIAISFCFVQLRELRQADIKPFSQLKHLDLYKNRLEFLGADVFKFNRKLELIWLSENKIKFIDDSTFDGLTVLSGLYLGFNDCISRSSADDPKDLQILLEMVKIFCGNKSKNGKYNPKTIQPVDDDYDDDVIQPVDDSRVDSLRGQLEAVEMELENFKRKREQALVWLVQMEDENRALKRSQNDSTAEIGRLKDNIKRIESAGVDYVKQIFGLREDLRKQLDSTDSIVVELKNKMTADADSLKYQKDEVGKLREQNLKMSVENRQLRDDFGQLAADKSSRDMTSVVVIILLAIGLAAAVGVNVYARIGGRSGRVEKSYNDFENATMKLVNEGASSQVN